MEEDFLRSSSPKTGARGPKDPGGGGGGGLGFNFTRMCVLKSEGHGSFFGFK